MLMLIIPALWRLRQGYHKKVKGSQSCTVRACFKSKQQERGRGSPAKKALHLKGKGGVIWVSRYPLFYNDDS